MSKRRVQPPKHQPATGVKAKSLPKKGKRGRPPTAATLKLRRIEAMLASAPADLRMTAKERVDFDAWQKELKKAEREILKTYKHDATTPNAHAYEMASIGDESLSGYERPILARDKMYKQRATSARSAIARTKIEKTNAGGRKTCQFFKDLLSRVRPLGPLSLSDATRRMVKAWPPEGLGKPVTERTLRTWIRRCSPFQEHLVGSVGLGKK